MYNYSNTTRVFEVNVDTYHGWLDYNREALRLAIDDVFFQVEIDDFWAREPGGEVRIVKVGQLVLGLIYNEVPDLLTIQDWVIDFEHRMNEIAADYDRETRWYLEDQELLGILAEQSRKRDLG